MNDVQCIPGVGGSGYALGQAAHADGLTLAPIVMVHRPADGALRLAQRLLATAPAQPSPVAKSA